MTKIREDIRQAFDKWLEKWQGVSSEFNTMYGHHLTSFNAGVLYSEATLSTRENEAKKSIEGK